MVFSGPRQHNGASSIDSGLPSVIWGDLETAGGNLVRRESPSNGNEESYDWLLLGQTCRDCQQQTVIARSMTTRLHIQSQEESQFNRRMFVYYYRLRDRYDCKIASLALLGDERENWRIQPFEEELWGCHIRFEFPVIKLLDYGTQWNELQQSRSPFSIAVMAHLKTKETKTDAQARKEWKFRLTRQLYEQGYGRQDILNLFRFIDWLMVLPEELKQAFRTELEQLEQERQMPYVTSIEQIAKAEGQAEGKAEERQAIALKMLQENLSVETIARLTELSVEQIQQLRSQLQNP